MVAKIIRENSEVAQYLKNRHEDQETLDTYI